jgi:membrane protease YdiL (CAAX protease family)
MSLQNGTIPLWEISENKLLNLSYSIQVMALAISLVAITSLYIYKKESFKTFFRFKIRLAKPTSDEENNWKFLGPIIAVAFTLGTMSYMSGGVISQKGQMNETFLKLFPLVILFAATNAWTEEILTRFVLVAGLDGKLSADAICWISSIIFGLGHIFGTPNGVFGVIASGALGWLLAKSVIETKGLGWALFIHFLQDVVIFGSGAMVLAGQH